MQNTDKYADIIDLPHPVSKKHKKMPIRDRAAQFSPFAALTGYEDAVRETARLTGERVELDDMELYVLDTKLNLLRASTDEIPTVSVTYFVPDEKKKGGKYVTASGKIKRIDSVGKAVVFMDGTSIPIADIIEIDSELFSSLDIEV